MKKVIRKGEDVRILLNEVEFLFGEKIEGRSYLSLTDCKGNCIKFIRDDFMSLEVEDLKFQELNTGWYYELVSCDSLSTRCQIKIIDFIVEEIRDGEVEVRILHPDNRKRKPTLI